jgi:hypothetical protein
VALQVVRTFCDPMCPLVAKSIPFAAPKTSRQCVGEGVPSPRAYGCRRGRRICDVGRGRRVGARGLQARAQWLPQSGGAPLRPRKYAMSVVPAGTRLMAMRPPTAKAGGLLPAVQRGDWNLSAARAQPDTAGGSWTEAQSEPGHRHAEGALRAGWSRQGWRVESMRRGGSSRPSRASVRPLPPRVRGDGENKSVRAEGRIEDAGGLAEFRGDGFALEPAPCGGGDQVPPSNCCAPPWD